MNHKECSSTPNNDSYNGQSYSPHLIQVFFLVYM